MALTLDTIVLHHADPAAAFDFYSGALASVAGQVGGTTLDVRGTGHLAVHGLDTQGVLTPSAGSVLAVIVSQPRDVDLVLEAASARGATVVKRAKKQFFGDYSAVLKAPDGTVVKVSAHSKKNSDATAPPTPVETAIFLGVASPRRSKGFYESLGMTADRDYGDTFVDFVIGSGECRLGLMPRKGLAKDAGAPELAAATGPGRVVLTHRAASADDVARIAEVAGGSGGQVLPTPARPGQRVVRFTDPDAYVWEVFAPE